MMHSIQLPTLLAATFVLGGLAGGGVFWLNRSSAPTESAQKPSIATLAPSSSGTESSSSREYAPQAPRQDPTPSQAGLHANTAEHQEEPGSDEGENLADALNRLELQYRALEAQLAAQREAELQAQLAAREPVTPPAYALPPAEQQTLNYASADSYPVDGYAARRAQNTISSPAIATTEPLAADGTTVAVNTMTQNTTNQQTNVVVVNNYPTVIYTGNAPGQQTRPAQHQNTNNWAQQQQAASFRPWTTYRNAYGGGTRSPWDPIDMSKHHNPWSSTRLP